MLVTPSPSVTVVNFFLPLNAEFPIVPFSIVIVSMLVDPLKTYELAIFVSAFPTIETVFKAVQFWKAKLPKVFIPLPIETLPKLVQL